MYINKFSLLRERELLLSTALAETTTKKLFALTEIRVYAHIDTHRETHKPFIMN